MGFAYTPGLTVAEHTVIRKVRRLPLKGQVMVKKGQKVAAEDLVAQTDLPGEVKPVNVAGQLGIAASELPEVLLKKEGDPVTEGEPYARTKGFFGLFKSELKAPITGKIESISSVTGQMIFQGTPTPLEKKAYVAGTIVETVDGESATVEVTGAFVQGIFGIGGEVTGPLVTLVDGPGDELNPAKITDAHRGKVIVGGGLVTAAAVKAAIKHGVHAIVSGGLDDADLRDFLGYELGVAITGEETLGVTLVITEGFGGIAMAHATFDLLKKLEGKLASVNGATQIRAGVIRPEVIVPMTEAAPSKGGGADEMDGILQVGSAVRAIREPYFGRIGRCASLPVELVVLKSETKVRVLEVEFEDGQKATLPRANIELIKH
ncbi:MAG: hypothetical protein KDA32_04495 [Phycisphaerales bacterium]|nr:hypothetical protein [Phycisphaerales bacterium]